MSVTPIDIHKPGGGNLVREHIERITSEHARMADLLRHLHAAHYGSPPQAIHTAREYGLEPAESPEWRKVLRILLASDIDDLLTEVYSASLDPASSPPAPRPPDAAR